MRWFGIVIACLAIAASPPAPNRADPLYRYTPAGMLETSQPPIAAPIAMRKSSFISVPATVEIGDFDSFFSWFVPLFPTLLPADREQPLREGWQGRGSHVRIFRDRIEIDAPLAPGIGSRVMGLCRMVVPITDRALPGSIVDAGSPGQYITQGYSNCEEDGASHRRNYDIANLTEQIDEAGGGHQPQVMTPRQDIRGKRGWQGQIVLSRRFAFEYGLILPLRLVKPGRDPAAFTFDPVEYDVIRTIDPLITHAFYRDGDVVSVVTFGLPDVTTSNAVSIGCVVFSGDRNTMLDRDPAVLSWCKAQVDSILPKVDRIVAAGKQSLPPAVRPF